MSEIHTHKSLVFRHLLNIEIPLGAIRVRGWFPRRCAVELVEDLHNGDEQEHVRHKNKKESKKLK